jgi:pyruvyltransferase
MRLLKKIGLNKLKTSNLINSYKVWKDEKLIVRWCPSNNWGDAISPLLIQKILNKEVIHPDLIMNINSAPVLYGVGSILSLYNDLNKIIWGSGFISSDLNNLKLSNPKTVLSVRGRYTNNLLKNLNFKTTSIFGDPVLLV